MGLLRSIPSDEATVFIPRVIETSPFLSLHPHTTSSPFLRWLKLLRYRACLNRKRFRRHLCPSSDLPPRGGAWKPAPHPAMTTTTEMRQHPGHPQNSKIFLLQLNFHHRAEKAEQLPATGRRQPASFGRCAFSNSQTLPKHAGPRRTSVNAPLLWRWAGSCSPNCCALPWNLSIFRDRAFKEAIKIKRNYIGGR